MEERGKEGEGSTEGLRRRNRHESALEIEGAEVKKSDLKTQDPFSEL